jgi:hypothetical protein
LGLSSSGTTNYETGKENAIINWTSPFHGCSIMHAFFFSFFAAQQSSYFFFFLASGSYAFFTSADISITAADRKTF